MSASVKRTAQSAIVNQALSGVTYDANVVRYSGQDSVVGRRTASGTDASTTISTGVGFSGPLRPLADNFPGPEYLCYAAPSFTVSDWSALDLAGRRHGYNQFPEDVACLPFGYDCYPGYGRPAPGSDYGSALGQPGTDVSSMGIDGKTLIRVSRFDFDFDLQTMLHRFPVWSGSSHLNEEDEHNGAYPTFYPHTTSIEYSNDYRFIFALVETDRIHNNLHNMLGLCTSFNPSTQPTAFNVEPLDAAKALWHTAGRRDGLFTDLHNFYAPLNHHLDGVTILLDEIVTVRPETFEALPWSLMNTDPVPLPGTAFLGPTLFGLNEISEYDPYMGDIVAGEGVLPSNYSLNRNNGLYNHPAHMRMCSKPYRFTRHFSIDLDYITRQNVNFMARSVSACSNVENTDPPAVRVLEKHPVMFVVQRRAFEQKIIGHLVLPLNGGGTLDDFSGYDHDMFVNNRRESDDYFKANCRIVYEFLKG